MRRVLNPAAVVGRVFPVYLDGLNKRACCLSCAGYVFDDSEASRYQPLDLAH